MSKILLINSVIREFAPPNNVPLGLLYIAAVLEEHGHYVDMCDLNALRWINPNREYWLEQYKRPYDFIGLSGLIVTFQEQRRYLDYIMLNYQEFGSPILISGGGLATSVPEFTMRHMPELDYLCIGEGEMPMLALVEGEKPCWAIPGIAWWRMFDPPRELISDLDSLPFPAWDKVPIEQVYIHNSIWGGEAGNSSKIGYKAVRSMNMIVSRGCPRSCNFCYHYVFGKKYRMRSVSNVIGEMITLKTAYALDFIGFVDDNTTANRDWVIKFCGDMIAADVDIKWGGSARVDQVDPDLLKLMKAAGCEFLGFGIESASPKVLEAMNKKADPDQAAEAIRMTREAGITANATFIVGYPGENKETLRATAKFMRDNSCLDSMFHIQPYPGTALYTQIKDQIIEKYEEEDAYVASLGDGTEFRINLSEMSDGELMQYRQMAMRGEPF